MSDKELKIYLSEIRNKAHYISKSKNKSIKFLQQIGLLNRNGNVKRKYKNICIPIDK